MSGKATRLSTAARKFAAGARNPVASACSSFSRCPSRPSRPLTSSSVNTIPATRRSASRNGATCTRRSVPFGRGGHRAGVGTLDFPLELLIDLVERVRDLVAIEQPEHRAAEPQRRVVARTGPDFVRSEEIRGARVVQEDPAVGVAHQDALGQLRHQRRKPVALLFDAFARIGALRLQIALEPAIAVGELIDRGRELAHLGAARGDHLCSGFAASRTRVWSASWRAACG